MIATSLLLILLVGCSKSFEQAVLSNQIKSTRLPIDFRVTFFGSSTFIIEDDNTQILIDGFFTRQKHRFFGRIQPSEMRILDAITKHKLCPLKVRKRESVSVEHCRSHPKKGLSIIIPVHGHYDHALDSSYIAAWAGTRLVADESVQSTFGATQEIKWMKKLDWDSVEFVNPFENKDAETTEITAGEFKIKLIRSQHSDNPLSSLAHPVTDKSLKFPAHLWQLGEGTALSVLVSKNGRSILIIPSAAFFSYPPEQNAYEADVMFLGIGGLGWKSTAFIEEYWKYMINASNASRVIPIHWDDDQSILQPGQQNLRPANFQRPSAALTQLEKLAKTYNKQLIFAPAERQFDPFLHLDEARQ